MLLRFSVYIAAALAGAAPATAYARECGGGRCILLAQADQVIDSIYANFQIIQVSGTTASGYLDIHNITKERFTQEIATKFFDEFARKADEILPFFSDKKLDSLDIQIIRITSIDEYNVGSGFTKVGNVRLVKQGERWDVNGLTVADEFGK